jgi:hypothetical protein
MIIHKNQIQQHTSVYDDGEEKTIFELGLIDHVTLARIIDSNVEVRQVEDSDGNEKRTIFHTDERTLLFVECGLKGWKNFKDEEGNDIAFESEEKVILGIKNKVVKQDCLKRLPYKVLQELGMAIRNLNMIGEIERKNS